MNKYIDHTVLKAFATKDDIIKLCNEAKEYNFKSVCVNPCYVKLAKELLINRHNMTEEQAHRYIQKKSMDTGKRNVEVAKIILN